MQVAASQVQGVAVGLRQFTSYRRAELRDALIHGRVHPAVRTAGPDLDHPLCYCQGPALLRIRGRRQGVQDGRGAQHWMTREVQNAERGLGATDSCASCVGCHVQITS
jgi:hypothetical protein